MLKKPDELVIEAMQQKLNELRGQSAPARERAKQAEVAAIAARQHVDEIDSMIAALENFLGQQGTCETRA